ncbi:MAG: Stk1 family PASTA domain-containing Ser/Thr kinase [Sporolactobacillus sp.]|jgi:serine/threonine-protein kinase|nr:Stk1 family PASTA domain-containing Ser/Thr kinase [Sporolactobacillus sp.]MCI1881857.1 Stk1 family PASTA domain-containing Ser/Thr kinase [Sporolactobacillus sp.]
MIGRRIGGRYQILSRLGDGGMAIVYKAQDLILDRPVAVKILRTELAEDEAFVKRFHREAEAVASLSHPNIVAIYDIGEEEDCYYIVMEYVHGMNLKTYIRDQSPISIPDAVLIMRQIVRAIAHAHAHGIVHRDIKPLNILIDDSGHVKVTDFGIAMAVSGATITFTHSILGSAHYLSPEQARGGKATVKSDIYSLGIVLFELLTGQLPFPGTSPVSVALKHLHEQAPFPRDLRPEIPQSLENVIIRSLAKDPTNRYASVVDMYHDLDTALSPERADEKRLMLKETVSDHDDDRTIQMQPVVGDKDDYQADELAAHPERKPDQGKGKKPSRAKKWLTLAGILIVLVTAGLILGLTVLPKLFYVDNVHVPNVVGQTFDHADRTMDGLDLTAQKRQLTSDKVKKGLVMRQDPEAGTEVKAGSSVTLYVSKGPEKSRVETYIGYNREAIAEDVEKQGYKKVVWHAETSERAEEGEIIRQKPAAGKQVVRSATVLDLTYSTGKPQVTVPNLYGKSKEEIDRLLAESGLSADFSIGDYSDDVAEGKATQQNPTAGSQVDKGTTVIVSLSKGPEEKPKEIDKPIKIMHSNNGDSSPIHVEIYYTDANHDDMKFADERVTETKTFTIPFTINPGEKGSYRVLIDGKTKKTGTVAYPKD